MIEVHTQDSIRTTVKTSVDLANKTDEWKIKRCQSLPPDNRYARTRQGHDGLYDVASFILKETYCVRIPDCIFSNTMITVASVVDTGAAQIWVIRTFFSARAESGLSRLNFFQLRQQLIKSCPCRRLCHISLSLAPHARELGLEWSIILSETCFLRLY